MAKLGELVRESFVLSKYLDEHPEVSFDHSLLSRDKEDDQTAKADAGKLPLTMVPREIIRAIAAIRRYGNEKYGDPENWRTVSVERYRDAAFRHWLAYLDDPGGCDAESGLPHLWHLACNVAFLCEQERWHWEDGNE